jgi:hypothetical protein
MHLLLLDQMRHAMGDDPRLAAARTSEHNQRSAGVRDRGQLFRIEA